MDKIYSDHVQETLYYQRIDNGLQVYLMPRENYNRQYAIFATNYGSIDNHFIDPLTEQTVKVPDGIAHFLEHKLFEGAEENAFAKFARMGASTNAFTNYTTTAYLFSSTDYFHESLLSLLDFVQEPYFTEENVEKEKGIIIQEIKMYEDDPGYQVFFNMLQGLYHQHPVKIDIGGTVESIQKISKDDLYLCYQTFYHPGNMVLFLTGNFTVEKTLDLIIKNQQKKDFTPWNGIKRIFPEEPLTVSQHQINKQMDVNQPLFRLGFKETEIDLPGRELVKQEIGTNILLDLIIGRSTQLYQNLYEEGLVDDDFGQHYVREKGYGYAFMGGKTKDPGLLNKRLLSGLYQAVSRLTEDDFNRILRKYIGDFIESFNNFEVIASEFINYFEKGVSYFDLLEIFQEINLDYLTKRHAVIFNKAEAVNSIISGNNLDSERNN